MSLWSERLSADDKAWLSSAATDADVGTFGPSTVKSDGKIDARPWLSRNDDGVELVGLPPFKEKKVNCQIYLLTEGIVCLSQDCSNGKHFPESKPSKGKTETKVEPA